MITFRNTSLMVCLSLMSVGAHAEVLLIAETGFITENKIQVSTDRETTWNAFVQVGQWWPADHSWWGDAKGLTIDAVAGGCFCEKSGNKSAEHMRITHVDAPNLMRMTGGLGPLQGMGMYGALDWVFVANDQGTEVTMTYRVNGINPDGFAELAPIVDQVQGLQLGGLKTLLDKTLLDAQ